MLFGIGGGWNAEEMENHGTVRRVERITELREQPRKAGLDPKSAPVSIFFAPPKREALDALAAAATERAIFALPRSPGTACFRTWTARSCGRVSGSGLRGAQRQWQPAGGAPDDPRPL